VLAALADSDDPLVAKWAADLLSKGERAAAQG
jgi:hypothetical protein